MSRPQANTRAPERFYEPNIIHNPLTWFGIWTPQGWLVHRKRWGRAQRVTRTIRADGTTSFFPGALRPSPDQPISWDDNLHLEDDPFTDGGIYPCDPRVEYPAGTPRWAVSHSLLCYPVADHGLFTHEYTWNMSTGDLHTHFRRHVRVEEGEVGPGGDTVRVACTPISTTIEGNRLYPQCNSAVRGVWLASDKSGRNLYTERVVRLTPFRNGVYATLPRSPVVQCRGIFPVRSTDPLDELFDPATREAADWSAVADRMHIPLDCPRVAMLRPSYRQVHSSVYEGPISVPETDEGVVDGSLVAEIEGRLGARFEPGGVGYAAAGEVAADARGYGGYDPRLDLDGDGQITAHDVTEARRHVGRRVRLNYYRSGYFGGDWVSTGSGLLCPEHTAGKLAVVDYDVGGGYDAAAGVVRLLHPAPPGTKVYVEYFHDAPPACDIIVHTYVEDVTESESS